MNLKGVVISGLSPLADIVGDMSLQPYWAMLHYRFHGTNQTNWDHCQKLVALC